MADIKKITEVSIQKDGVETARGLIYVPIERVIGLDESIEEKVNAKIDENIIEEVKTKWIIV